MRYKYKSLDNDAKGTCGVKLITPNDSPVSLTADGALVVEAVDNL
jgi:hypothetical protein